MLLLSAPPAAPREGFASKLAKDFVAELTSEDLAAVSSVFSALHTLRERRAAAKEAAASGDTEEKARGADDTSSLSNQMEFLTQVRARDEAEGIVMSGSGSLGCVALASPRDRVGTRTSQAHRLTGALGASSALLWCIDRVPSASTSPQHSFPPDECV